MAQCFINHYKQNEKYTWCPEKQCSHLMFYAGRSRAHSSPEVFTSQWKTLRAGTQLFPLADFFPKVHISSDPSPLQLLY